MNRPLCFIIFVGCLISGLAAQEAIPDILQTLRIEYDFNDSPSVSEDAKNNLKMGLRDWLSNLEPRLLIEAEPTISVPSKVLDETEATTSTNDTPSVMAQVNIILQASFKENTKGQLSVQIRLLRGDGKSELLRVSTKERTRDPRMRDLNASFFEELSERCRPWLKPILGFNQLRIISLPASLIVYNDKRLVVPENGLVEIQVASGRTFEFEVWKEGYFKEVCKVLADMVPGSQTQEYTVQQTAYQNNFILGIGLTWVRFPTVEVLYPIYEEELYASLSLNFYGLGLRYNDSDSNVTDTLASDLHSLEIGGGLVWYINSHKAEFRLVTGLSAYARFDLQGEYLLDLLSPVVFQANLGADIALDRNFGLLIQLLPRYTFSQDPNLAMGVTEDPYSWDTNPQKTDFDLGRFINTKYSAGPGVFEPFVFYLGVRVQL